MLDYEKKYKEALNKNINSLISNINNKDFKLKIKNWANKFDCDPMQVREKILNDKLFLYNFAKDPAKQSIHENLAVSYIKGFNNLDSIEHLPKQGKKTLHMYKGNVVNKANHKIEDVISKSIDFKVVANDRTFYCAHKYTREGGGMQDSQRKDAEFFLEHSVGCKLKGTYFIAILDGAYYTKKLDRINNRFNQYNNIAAMTIESFRSLIEDNISSNKIKFEDQNE